MDLPRQVELLSGWLSGVNVTTGEARASIGTRITEAIEKWQAPFTTSGPATERELLRASLHESAHGIAAVLSGVDVTGILLRGDGTGGFTYNTGTADSSPFVLAALIETDLSGCAAEIAAGFVDTRRAFALSHSPDILSAAARLARLRTFGSDHWQPRMLAAITIATIHTHWDTVQRVAACLRAVGSLSGAEVRALMGRPQ